MSALWLEFTLILCIYGTGRTVADVKAVVRRHVGDSITIQCDSTPNQESLNLKKGLNEEDVFYIAKASDKPTIDSKFTDRLQFHKNFPKVDILIKNLTLNDTGPYWCVYKMLDKDYVAQTTKGSGSVLLVVTENGPSTAPTHQCQSSLESMILLPVLICAVVIIVILALFLITIFLKNKSLHDPEKPRQVPTNDVYEDMRGTIRR